MNLVVDPLERTMDTTEFLRQLRIAVMGALLVFGLAWFLAGTRSTLLVMLG